MEIDGSSVEIVELDGRSGAIAAIARTCRWMRMAESSRRVASAISCCDALASARSSAAWRSQVGHLKFGAASRAAATATEASERRRRRSGGSRGELRDSSRQAGGWGAVRKRGGRHVPAGCAAAASLRCFTPSAAARVASLARSAAAARSRRCWASAARAAIAAAAPRAPANGPRDASWSAATSASASARSHTWGG